MLYYILGKFLRSALDGHHVGKVKRMRKTKIICTLGPATDNPEVLKQLMLSGMNVARINMSHQNHECHKARIEKVKELREELRLPIAVLIDTKGPEIRLGAFKEPKVELIPGETFTLTTEPLLGDGTIASISFPGLPGDVERGQHILIDDGLIDLQVQSATAASITCTVLNGGVISANKGVNVPGAHLSMPFMSERDKQDIAFACEMEADFIAASFTRRADDVLQIRQELEKNNNHSIRIIAKIENAEGVDNIDDILKVSDGIMVARGDMGVEIAMEEIPSIQKKLIHKGYNAGLQVITATQMLDSMMRNPRPTRAEVSDVANAVFDGTSCVMLSGETASGKYPLEAVRTMADTVLAAEQAINYWGRFQKMGFSKRAERPISDAISHSCCTTALDLEAKAILVATQSGNSARVISRFRPGCTIAAFTTTERVRRQLAITWGVHPFLFGSVDSTDRLLSLCVECARKEEVVSAEDTVVITAGVPIGQSGTTNLIKAQVVGEKI